MKNREVLWPLLSFYIKKTHLTLLRMPNNETARYKSFCVFIKLKISLKKKKKKKKKKKRNQGIRTKLNGEILP